MFDFQRQVRLKQAENAFKDGRLDEAFAIACEKEIRDLRGGQVLLEGLVDPLLDRAEEHFSGGRLKEALLDVEKALHAGGNRSRAAELRKEVGKAMEKRALEGRRVREAIKSARGHLLHGSLHAGLEVLDSAPGGSTEAEQLRREVESLKRRAAEARARASAFLSQGDLIEALTALWEATAADARDEELSELKSRAKKLTVEAIADAIEKGELATASALTSRLLQSVGESLEARRFVTTLGLCNETARALLHGDLDGARIAVARLERQLPGTTWVQEACLAVTEAFDALATVRSGPLGQQLEAREGYRQTAQNSPSLGEGAAVQPPLATIHGPEAPPLDPSSSPPTRARESMRWILWVDGVGTYLILGSPRISLGRTGSSADPEIALAVDIAGLHAEIFRSEDDYFLVAAQGKVEIAGQSVTRRLLSNGDLMVLGAATKILFELPSPLTPSALLTLKNQRIERDVRKVILLKDNLLMGASENCHVQVSARPSGSCPVILSLGPAGLVCKADDGIQLSGQPAGRQALLPLGARVQIGELTFTITNALENLET